MTYPLLGSFGLILWTFIVKKSIDASLESWLGGFAHEGSKSCRIFKSSLTAEEKLRGVQEQMTRVIDSSCKNNPGGANTLVQHLPRCSTFPKSVTPSGAALATLQPDVRSMSSEDCETAAASIK